MKNTAAHMEAELVFVTGNQHKAEKASQLLGRPLKHQKVELDEIQTVDLARLVEHKVRQAYDKIQAPVIVDDFSYGFNALNGLPGPFTKFFVESHDGAEKMCRMIDSFDDRSAVVTSAIGYFDGNTLMVFERSLGGTTAKHPKGTNGIGTDTIFIPDGYTKTRAELDDKEYDKVYEAVRPFDELRKFLDEHEPKE
ncbi:MAG TPA: non-canonical purine NTP pyrophosphatase [Candidatus Saccharibacteria bacterium]|nr:non-canonical purine NTP pyrophosphatase [Candidatus Saccharibacteria bacterium]HRK94562.1 non-canonical purine NTP pyrophosphatase [Candidatus Saccharibacteria bacterium]